MKRFLVLSAVLFTATLVNSPRAQGGGVPICHIPPGNPENAHMIYVDEHAVEAHMAHGDMYCCPGGGGGGTIG